MMSKERALLWERLNTFFCRVFLTHFAYPGCGKNFQGQEYGIAFAHNFLVAHRPAFTGLPDMSDVFDRPLDGEEPNTSPFEGDVVEMPLLLPGWQVTKLETAAHKRGMTAAAMVRNLLRDFLSMTPA